MVCQNQSIDDSDAPLARDLRILVRERLTAGDSDAQVLDFLVARYGAVCTAAPAVRMADGAAVADADGWFIARRDRCGHFRTPAKRGAGTSLNRAGRTADAGGRSAIGALSASDDHKRDRHKVAARSRCQS